MESLPFEDGTFDFVYQIASLEFARDPRAALREVARVLRPGGRYVLGLVSHQSLFGLLKPGRREAIPQVDLTTFREELRPFHLTRTHQDIFLPPWNVPSIRRWGPSFERLAALVGHGGARHMYLFRRI